MHGHVVTKPSQPCFMQVLVVVPTVAVLPVTTLLGTSEVLKVRIRMTILESKNEVNRFPALGLRAPSDASTKLTARGLGQGLCKGLRVQASDSKPAQ